MTLIAIDLGGTKLATAAFSAGGDLLDRESVPLDGRAGADVGALVVERARAMRERLRASGAPAVRALGAAVPGIYRATRGTVWAPNIPDWDDYPLRDELQDAFGPAVRVGVDSDRAACVLGETWRGAAGGARNAIVLVVGTGIGAGILVDGRVLRGQGDIAGAIGWLALDRPFREQYVACGCFEHHASGPGLAKVARELLAASTDYAGELRHIPPDELAAEHLFDAFDRQDPVALAVIEDAVQFWGMAAANLVSLFDPEIVVFGGGVFGPAARLLDRIRDEAVRWGQPIAMRATRFATTTLGGDAVLYGAARLTMLGDESTIAIAPPSLTPHS